MVGLSLLQSDDDSDVPDLDLPTRIIKRRKMSSDDEFKQRRHNMRRIMTLSSIVISIILIYFTYTALSKVNQINQEIRDLRMNIRAFEEMHLEISKMKMEMEFIKENLNSDNSTNRPITTLIYDQLSKLSSKLQTNRITTQSTIRSIEDVTRRMSRVEQKCLAVCQQQPQPFRDKQRRRQSGISNFDDADDDNQIVFNRNNQ